MKIFIFAILFFLTGCATTQQAINKLDIFKGAHVDEFFKLYGMPSKKYEFDDKSIVYRWSSSVTNYQMPSITSYKGNVDNYSYGSAYTEGGGVVSVVCIIDLYTDTNGFLKRVNVIKDTWGNWNASRCAEIFDF